jgi:hypothetical protein
MKAYRGSGGIAAPILSLGSGRSSASRCVRFTLCWVGPTAGHDTLPLLAIEGLVASSLVTVVTDFVLLSSEMWWNG